MKKSSFIALVLGTISGVFFALGMCMALIPEWNAFEQGIIFGCIGLVLAVITMAIWRRMEKKAPIKLSGKMLLIIAISIVGTLLLGVGLCFVMIWERMVTGIIVGILAIVLLFTLIPLTCGIKD